MVWVARLASVIALVVSIPTVVSAQQFADPEFDATVARPAFTSDHPRVLIDEAHNNFHTAGGRYKPFTDLIKSDGYAVASNKEKFAPEVFKDCSILVVANAQGAPLMRSPEAARSAFDEAECGAVRTWIEGGGSLLLIADHHPWGPANESLAARLGVDMGKSMTYDPANSEAGLPAQLNFTRVNGLIGDHPIMRGRDGSERIDRILTFAGQSLKGPEGAAILLKFAASAADLPRPAIPGREGAAAGRAQGLAFALGRGKVVVLGEAGMLSAQVNGRRRLPMGMNVPGTDNRQFALNVMHWLSGVKFPAAEAVAANSKLQPATSKSGGSATTAMPATTPTRPSGPLRSLSPAEIAAESEASIAMITGDGSVGTGFLVRPGILATNAHVIDGEFVANLRVRFPSAAKAQQGPITTSLLYEDSRRDLAFLRVKTSLPPLRVALAYTFRKGEDVTAIGNPGAGDELILENAISRGLMSTRTSLEGQRYYQLGIAVNPGNSGGPVFNSTGEVIGVVTRKSTEQESLAFCVPIEDLNLAIEKVVSLPPDAIERQESQHRLILAVKELGGLGALYCTVIAGRDGKAKEESNLAGIIYDAAVAGLQRQTVPRLKAEVARVRDDALVPQPVRENLGRLADNLDKLKALHDAKPPKGANDPLPDLRSTHQRLLKDLCKGLKLDIPGHILMALDPRREKKAGAAATTPPSTPPPDRAGVPNTPPKE